MHRWLPLLCALLAAAPGQAAPLSPWQGSASLAAGLGRRPADGAAFFLGHAWGGGVAGRPLPFLALGGELSVAGPRAPGYDTALGLQLRAGLAWTHANGAGPLWPELLVFARVAPFVAVAPLRAAEGALEPGFGVRAGVGLTASAWTQALLRLGFPEEALEPGLLGEVMRVVTGLVLLPVAFLNHVELTLEVSGPPGYEPARLVALRVGSGF